MRGFKLLAIAGSIAVLSVGIAACGGDDDGDAPAEADFELTVGALIPLTGDLSVFGPAGQKAAELAVDVANEALQEAGSGISVADLQIGDTETRPQPAQSAARQLIADGASCLAGAWGSAQTIPVGQAIAARQEIPLISPASTSAEITDLPDEGYVFRTAPSDFLQGEFLAEVVADELGSDATISVAARNDSYGEGFVTRFIDSFEELGGTVTGPVLYDLEAPSYDSEAADIVGGNPDGFVIIDFEEPYNQLGGALARTGDFDATLLYTGDGLAAETIPEGIPAAALDGANGTRPGTPEDTDIAQEWGELYADSPGPSARGTFDAQNFDAVMLCILGAVAAGSDEGPAIRDEIQGISGSPGDQYDYRTLADAITALQDGEEIDFQGVTGPLDFDDNGDPTAATYDLWEYQDGELVVLDQRQAETD